MKTTHVHTLIIGSGAAGLNAAVQLHANGVEDILIITEGLSMGTSINTGSDKQTYYKLGLYGDEPDSPVELGKSFFNGGSMHGDLALTEASLSARAFMNLVNLGVPFPQDAFGQFVGYKTDHDPRQRATSVGPYTSKMMCEKLIAEVKRRDISVNENRHVVSLLTLNQDGEKRAVGAIAVHADSTDGDVEDSFETYIAENVVFAVGGPGGLYKTSVYPNVHTGAIGLALMEGACGQGLPESQFGMASTKFRWNVSGTYMQVMPKFISTAADGTSDLQEFMLPYFDSVGAMNSAIFLKGYQWPFDTQKAANGSSIVDILVYIETVLKGRRVFMDFRDNGEGFSFEGLEEEAYHYLERSDALFGIPLTRLEKMNPAAIHLYEDHGIHLVHEPLEIAVCAQHNNGGLAGTHWWESTNIKHLFPLGEVNGTHGVCRPGGSALNSGQVAGFRAADFIANKYNDSTLSVDAATQLAETRVQELSTWLNQSRTANQSWQDVRAEFQQRMTEAGAHIRSKETIEPAIDAAWKQWQELKDTGCGYSTLYDAVEALRNHQLCFAHAVYLEAIKEALEQGVGSRGSGLVLDPAGQTLHDKLDASWTFVPENAEFRKKVLETEAATDGSVVNRWVACRPIPESNAWFENAWADFREGKIYQ